MVDFRQAQIILGFQFGSIDNQVMTLMVNDQLVDNTTCEFTVTLPTQVTIQTSGKNMNTDTVVDDSGNIVADKFIKLISLKLDRIEIPTIYLPKIVNFDNGVDQFTTNYFGFNGTASINLDRQSVFQQYHHFVNLGLA